VIRELARIVAVGNIIVGAPTGACYFTKDGQKVCVPDQTQNDCIQIFHGDWYQGEPCKGGM
jgi:hypothetical protein